MNKKLFFLLAALFLGGCATPVDKSEITPKLYSNAGKNIGIVRGGFGIPIAVDRPGRPAQERFVDYPPG